MKTSTSNIGLSEKVGYGFGDMSSSMFWKIFSYYLPFFYSNVFGLSLADAGTLLLITKLYDAVSDPLMGIIADRTSTRWGKYRPYILWCAVPFALIGVMTFYTPESTYAVKHAYAYVSYLFMMTVYTAVNVPYGAMLGVMTPNSKEKTVFSSFRMFFAYAGSFIALALFEPLCKLFRSGSDNLRAEQLSWTYSMIVVGVICALLFVGCFLMTKERVTIAAMSDNPSKEADAKGSIRRDLRALVGNRPWWLLLATAIGVLLFNSIRGGVAAYYFKDVVGGNAIYSCGVWLAIGEIANMAGVALAVPVSARLGKRMTYIAALGITVLASTAIYFLPLNTGGLWALMILQIVAGMAAGITFPLLWSMFADIADYSEYKNGNSSTGLIFSSSSMAQKFGGAFGSALILWTLAAFGYDTSSECVVQSVSAVEGLKAMMSWIPAVGSLIAIAALIFYPLTDSKMAEISAVLSKRRNIPSK